MVYSTYSVGNVYKTVRCETGARGGQFGAPLTGHIWQVSSVAFSLDGKRMVSGATHETLCWPGLRLSRGALRRRSSSALVAR